MFYSKNEIKKRVRNLVDHVPEWKIFLIREILLWRQNYVFIHLTPDNVESILELLCLG